jgi:hypothetical protein
MKSLLKGCAIVLALVLVVWGGIEIMPSLLGRTERRPETRTLIFLQDVRVALNNWNTEYNALPMLRGEVLKEDVDRDVNGDLLEALQGEPVAGNERGIAFLNVNSAKSKKPGVVKDAGEMRLVDQWGRTLRVMLDGNGDNKLANPDVKNSEEKIRSTAPEQLRTRVAVFSGGKDGVLFTRDDLVSWR